MNKTIKLFFLFFAILLAILVFFIYQQSNKIKKLTALVNEMSTRVDPEVDLSDIVRKVDNLSDLESRVDDLESENESLKTKLNMTTTSPYFDAEYENRKLERRIDELENKLQNQ